MRGVFCSMLVWIIMDGQIEGLLGNSFILFLCQRYYQTLRPNKNFHMNGNLILYLMRYTFRRVNLFLASAGQMYGRYLTWLIFQGLMT